MAVYGIPRYVLYFGRYTEEKGIRTVVEAARELPDILFVCAGKGPLEAELFDKKVDNVINVGFQSGVELTSLIASAQFVVVPSQWYEPFGLSVMEAMQLGTPVIGSKTGGITELIMDGKSGIMFEAGNKEQLIEVIRNLWREPERIREFSVNCGKTEAVSLEYYSNRLVMEFYSS